jgi:hypothetical protein
MTFKGKRIMPAKTTAKKTTAKNNKKLGTELEDISGLLERLAST